MKKIIIALVILILIILGAFFLLKNDSRSQRYITQKADRGDIRSTVSATGTVNAVTTVSVGTQVSGTIKQLFADFNSPVKKGQLLAQIDPASIEAQVAQASANLSLARANLEKSKVAVRDTLINFKRNKILYGKNFISKSDLDTSETNYLSSIAQVKASEAQVRTGSSCFKPGSNQPSQYTNYLPRQRHCYVTQRGCRTNRGRQFPDTDSFYHCTGSDKNADRCQHR